MLLLKKTPSVYTIDSAAPFTISINSVGIISGLIDVVVQAPSYPNFAVNNTYGIKAYNSTIAAAAVQALNQPGGCLDQGRVCRSLQAEGDPLNRGNNQTVNLACLAAFSWCWQNVYGPYEAFSGVRIHPTLCRLVMLTMNLLEGPL